MRNSATSMAWRKEAVVIDSRLRAWNRLRSKAPSRQVERETGGVPIAYKFAASHYIEKIEIA